MATRTYNSTTFHHDLTKATIKLYIHEGSKYDVLNDDNTKKVEVTGVKSWTIVEGGEEALAIENLLGIEDKYHAYLILTYADNHTEIYENTKVEMFIR